MTGRSANDDDAAMAAEAAFEATARAAEQDALEAEADAMLNDTEAGQGQGFADPVAFLTAELDKAETENAELKDQALRLAAEMENLRRRTAKDVKDARQFSIAGFAREMLAVSDNLRRAINAIPNETREAGDAGLLTLIEGVELTERSMVQALEKHDVKKITPLNERFDPHLHQAMFEIPNTQVPNNTVLEVVQDGYVIGERCLRPAMVGVAKGGPKLSVKPDDTENEASDG